ncbi:hypothetical protein GMOD_00006594 [Pyrenophora seminiperda CCB06]|uniref:Uncharacterized protein n=1 Tax=Pyrenophora seminiperda CCB06 TaxID=1302712 RepID=A0A3M7MAH1_9PLEO|nr:hypothetical protein GMOD_00006594 [Pyrenophora seminiperda CCB06]
MTPVRLDSHLSTASNTYIHTCSFIYFFHRLHLFVLVKYEIMPAPDTKTYNVYIVTFKNRQGPDHEGIALVPAQLEKQDAGRYYHVKGNVGMGMTYGLVPAERTRANPCNSNYQSSTFQNSNTSQTISLLHTTPVRSWRTTRILQSKTAAIGWLRYLEKLVLFCRMTDCCLNIPRSSNGGSLTTSLRISFRYKHQHPKFNKVLPHDLR